MLKRLFSLLTTCLLISQITVAQDQNLQTVTSNNETGYFNTTEFSFSKGFLKENKSFYTGLQTINGYRFNNHISAGLGTGIDQYFYKNYRNTGNQTGETYLPIFSDVRIYIGKGKTRPFFSQAVGYSFCIRRLDFNRETKFYKNIGGIMINPSVGITTPISEKTALNFSLGYRLQETTIKNIPYYNGYDNNYDVNNYVLANLTWAAHYLTFRAGLTF